MPAKSAAQKRLMDAAAHNPAFAQKVGIPPKVAKEYSKASKGQTFKRGGEMKKLFGGKETYKEELAEAKAVKAKKVTPRQFAKYEKEEGHGEEKGKAAMARKIASGKMSPSKYAKMESGEKYARGGGIETKGKTKGTMVKMAGGGYVRSADGCATKGKTKGKMV